MVKLSQRKHNFYFIGLLLLIIATPFSLLVTQQKSNEETHASSANTPAATDPIIVAAGDIACPSGQSMSTTQCQQKATSDLVLSINPTAVLTIGDEQYEDGTYAQFMGTGAYNDTWGRFKSITKPVPGNHEYHTTGASGYFDYFNGVNQQTGIAGDRSKGYYSYDIGSWHFIALNSEQDTNAGGAQEVWLKQDLAAHTNAQCTAAYWHQPEFSSGYHPSNTYFKAFWDDLYAAKADLILNGHSHDYERFLAQDPSGNLDSTNGIIEIGSGMGGDAPEAATGTKPNSVLFQNTVFGVVKLTLHQGSYDMVFVPIPGQSFSDSLTGVACHKGGITQLSPTTQPLTQAPTGISPTYFCFSGQPCTSPPATPTPTQQAPNPTLDPNTTVNPTITQPCTISSSASTQDAHGKKHAKHTSNSGISGFFGQFLSFLLQLLQLLLQLFGGTLPTPTPTPTPVPTQSVNPTSVDNPTATQIPGNPCPTATQQPTSPSDTPTLNATISPAPTLSPAPTSATTLGPKTSLHYTANSNFSGSTYTPGAYGFNLADVSTVSEVNGLPTGVKGLVYLNMCNGADTTFVNTVTPFVGNQKVFGFMLIDEPDPTGQYKTLCSPASLKAESDYIHSHVTGAKTFIVLMNMSSSKTPTYMNTYNPANSDIDYYGIDAYPCRTDYNGCDYSIVTRNIPAAQSAGIPASAIIPVYQTFGGGSWVDDGGGSYTMPTASEEQQLLQTWATVIPSPAFDYAYSWGSQNGDQALSGSSSLQQVFATHNK